MEEKIDDLLITFKNSLEDPDVFKHLDFPESLNYFSKNENKFIKAFRSFETHEIRIQIFSKLFLFLPITENIIKLILEKKIFEYEIFYNFAEEDNISTYFSKTKDFSKKLTDINIDPSELKKNIDIKEKELNSLKKINNNLQNKNSEINIIKKDIKKLKKEIFDKNISSEKNFKIDKLYEKIKRFNNKLYALKEDYDCE
ncbi:hypothetical protein [Cetobacterium sp. SF1]|uniref:hypothetical protein n=1 Tax=unclassified Cetobacterium TaxID=2630983 RepID=UPI003CED0E00